MVQRVTRPGTHLRLVQGGQQDLKPDENTILVRGPKGEPVIKELVSCNKPDYLTQARNERELREAQKAKLAQEQSIPQEFRLLLFSLEVEQGLRDKTTQILKGFLFPSDTNFNVDEAIANTIASLKALTIVNETSISSIATSDESKGNLSFLRAAISQIFPQWFKGSISEKDLENFQRDMRLVKLKEKELYDAQNYLKNENNKSFPKTYQNNFERKERLKIEIPKLKKALHQKRFQLRQTYLAQLEKARAENLELRSQIQDQVIPLLKQFAEAEAEQIEDLKNQLFQITHQIAPFSMISPVEPIVKRKQIDSVQFVQKDNPNLVDRVLEKAFSFASTNLDYLFGRPRASGKAQRILSELKMNYSEFNARFITEMNSLRSILNDIGSLLALDPVHSEENLRKAYDELKVTLSNNKLFDNSVSYRIGSLVRPNHQNCRSGIEDLPYLLGDWDLVTNNILPAIREESLSDKSQKEIEFYELRRQLLEEQIVLGMSNILSFGYGELEALKTKLDSEDALAKLLKKNSDLKMDLKDFIKEISRTGNLFQELKKSQTRKNKNQSVLPLEALELSIRSITEFSNLLTNNLIPEFCGVLQDTVNPSNEINVRLGEAKRRLPRIHDILEGIDGSPISITKEKVLMLVQQINS
ncbi:MAG: hypothetical protein SFU25_01930, partial [Candidatus Caenarcaniphilales bacterium]|nr:hypothetical protein [Candidatus Caenarcaniphilales bacterium]